MITNRGRGSFLIAMSKKINSRPHNNADNATIALSELSSMSSKCLLFKSSWFGFCACILALSSLNEGVQKGIKAKGGGGRNNVEIDNVFF